MKFEQLSPQEFKNQLSEDQNGILLDVRTPEEFAENKIENAINIDIYGDFVKEIEKLDKSKNYYLYCRSGARSATACQFISTNGFEGKIYNLQGGILAWEKYIN